MKQTLILITALPQSQWPHFRRNSTRSNVVWNLPIPIRLIVLPILLALVGPLSAADLTLLGEGKSDYQIVVPDNLETPELTQCLNQMARLVQTTFKANGAEVCVVTESERDAAKPAILLGNTQLAQKSSIDVTKLADWGYVHRVIGRDIVIVGHDHAAKSQTESTRRPNWDRVGTAKAAVDFVRQFMGVRFLYPDMPPYTPISGAAKVDLLASPAIEFLPMKTMVVPAGLNVAKTPVLRLNTAHPAGGGFYDLAHNRFPRVDEVFGGHTWERAVPAELFARAPGVFRAGGRLAAQAGGRRGPVLLVERSTCRSGSIATSPPGWIAATPRSTSASPTAFASASARKCNALFGTGKDWSEKIWIFNRQVAERLESVAPGSASHDDVLHPHRVAAEVLHPVSREHLHHAHWHQ